MGPSDSAKRLKSLRSRAIGLRELARKIRWDASRYQYYEDQYKKPYLPRDLIEKIAPYIVGQGDPAVSEVELFSLAGVEPAAAHGNITAMEQKKIAADVILPPRSQMPKDIPVLGTVSGGGGGFQMNGEPIDWARRPPKLDGRADVFGAYVEDLSMIPAFRPGALVLCERARPPAPGDDVIIDLKPSNARDEHKTLIKHLIALTPKVVRVEQYNPPKVLEFDRKQVAALFRVIPLNDLLGV